MLRNLQRVTSKNIDTMCKAKSNMKRGMLVEKDLKNKTFSPANNIDECYFVDRSLVVTDRLAMGLVVSDYDEDLENINQGDFAELEAPFGGERWATDAFDGADSGLEAGKYLKIKDGKFITSSDATRFKSIGFIIDSGTHKLLGVQIIK